MSTGLGGKVAGRTILGLVLLAAAAWIGVCIWAGDSAPRHARVEGVSIAGLEPGEAAELLRTRLDARASAPVEVSVGDGRSTQLDPAEAGLSVDHAASVERATGGTGFGPRRLWAVVTGGKDHHAEVRVDRSRLETVLDEADRRIGTPPREGTLVFRDGKAVPVLGRSGVVVDRGRAQSLLERRFLHPGVQKLPTVSRDPEVSDAGVRRALADFGRPAMSGPVRIAFGGRTIVATPTMIGSALTVRPEDGELVPRVDGEALLEALEPALGRPGVEPRDARIVVKAGRPRVVPSQAGVELDPAELQRELPAALTRRPGERRLEVKGRSAEPELTTADARALKVTRRVSTFTTNFPYAEYRNVNLSRAAELIDGTLLKPGETFSLNRTVGERTTENGFTEGTIISDGIFKKDLGGGVSQIATTTFNAMFFAGLEDVEHKPHSVYIDRYPEGREATVAWPSLDLRFRNDSPYGVLIKARVAKSSPSQQGAATVEMYSTKRWEITSTTSPRRSFRSPAVRVVTDEDCEEASGTTGFTVDVHRYFRDLDSGKVQRKERFTTDYIAGDAVQCRPGPG